MMRLSAKMFFSHRDTEVTEFFILCVSVLSGKGARLNERDTNHRKRGL